MLPHQERVVTEQAELAVRLNKLDCFLVGPLAETLPMDDRRLLVLQASVMASYLGILEQRIERFSA